MPNRRQAIIWTNYGEVYRCIYVSLGFNELILSKIPLLVQQLFIGLLTASWWWCLTQSMHLCPEHVSLIHSLSPWPNLTHWGRDKMDDIFQMTFSNEFSQMKMYEFWFKISLKFVLEGSCNNFPTLVHMLTQTQDIFSLATVAWKHLKYPCFCLLPLEFEVNIDIHKHENNEVIYSNSNKSPKEMSGNSRLKKTWKTCWYISSN